MAVVVQEGEPDRPPPDLPPEEAAWRPRSGHDVLLSDRDLAKLGLLAQLETQCRSNLAVALKGALSLSTSEWMKLESVPFEQLVDRLAKAANRLDSELMLLVNIVAAEHADVLKHRHQNLHSLWAHNSKTGGLMAWDLKRNETLHPLGLDEALNLVADLTFKTKACTTRVAQLIAEGALPESTEERGPWIRWADRWIKI